ncbi:hypothetical protein EMUCRT_0004 [Ehrlichia cf. muris str. EmCRT]|uniref:Uncharacterized protein n=1 Tax=Ehrlichia cf. muris str. EmCRT TaxID=1359167 RepID=A0A0F3NG01_9RICK|nr:hypothetical protein EMUCRT_0734 [Ehrlichia cf. muris str. EmCRT]KJV65824.1 hypothetical protein EMUCRT_0004 [Ehrlichia cf. muris str. EmCRT]
MCLLCIVSFKSGYSNMLLEKIATFNLYSGIANEFYLLEYYFKLIIKMR